MSSDENYYRKVWLARNTVIEMLIDRKYTVSYETISDLESFKTHFPDLLAKSSAVNMACHHQIKNSDISVNFILDDKLPKKVLETIVQDNIAKGFASSIIVTFQKLNHSCISYCDIIRNSLFVESFVYDELLFNPTKHVLVPHHRIMDEAEIDELLKKYSCRLENLPKILNTDKIARYLGAKVSNVLEIIRNSKTAGTSKYYRLVRNP